MVNVAQIATAVAVERTLVVGRPTVRGKFLYVGKEKFWVRGVSYGTFFVDDDGEERLNPEMVARDFALMAANGFNVVRVHTGPPRWLLDMALENGLRVMVGLNWESKWPSWTNRARSRKSSPEFGSGFAPAPVIRRFSATASETKSRRRSSVGMGGSGSRNSSSASTAWRRKKTRTPW